MLGHAVTQTCRNAGLAVLECNRPEVDISRENHGLDDMPVCDWVVNCASYTKVDEAESHGRAAFAVNREGAGRVAEWCKKRGSSLLHISSDYVFDGRKTTPYREDDPVAPVNVYGESKLAGETAIRATFDKWLIVRTQSLFGLRGTNFVSRIISQIETGGRVLNVVRDQTTCPTHTAHLAGAILRLLRMGKHGMVHVSSSGNCAWHEFAAAIVEEIGADATIRPVGSDEYPSAARRPAYSVLDKSLYTSWTGDTMPSWREGLRQYLDENGKRQRGLR